MNLNLVSSSKIIDDYINFVKFNLKNIKLVPDLKQFIYPFKNNIVKKIIKSPIKTFRVDSFYI